MKRSAIARRRERRRQAQQQRRAPPPIPSTGVEAIHAATGLAFTLVLDQGRIITVTSSSPAARALIGADPLAWAERADWWLSPPERKEQHA